MRSTFSVLFAVALALAAHPLNAQPYESVGARAAGMGGAFVAVADDATAAYWNPAALAAGPLFSLVIDRQTVVDGGSGTFVGIGVPAVAVTYYRLRAVEGGARIDREDPGSAGVSLRSLVTHHTGISLVHSFTSAVSIGTTLRFVRATANSVDADVGLLATNRRVRLGLAARNLRRPTFDVEGRAFVVPRQVRAGLAVRPDDGLTIALDADLTKSELPGGARDADVGPRARRMLAAGAERAFGTRWAARAGVRASTIGPAAPVAAVGVSGALWGPIWVDGHAALGSHEGDRGWGVAARMVFGQAGVGPRP